MGESQTTVKQSTQIEYILYDSIYRKVRKIQNHSDRNQITGWGPGEKDYLGAQETFMEDEYVRYLDCGDRLHG